jgi:hypothetical protein
LHIGPVVLFALCMLLAATPGLAVEPQSGISAAEVDPSETPSADHAAAILMLDVSVVRDIAARLSARAELAADQIVRDETRRLTERLVRLEDESSTVADEISTRVDARLGTAMKKLRGNAYASATSPKIGEL